MELDLNSLTAHRILGRGAMGTVFLVSSPTHPLPFALKVIDKLSPNSKPESDRRARWEISVLSVLSPYPFLPTLLSSSETPSLLSYAFPFCPAGDLNSLRHSLPDQIFSLSSLKFYLSEILLALSTLHSLNILYRDLKPENVLIDSNGHVVLSDFDLSRHLSPNRPEIHLVSSTAENNDNNKKSNHRRNLTRIIVHTADNLALSLKKTKSARVSSCGGFHKSYSFVGTEEYVAPEIIRGEGHDYSVDFWALGVLAYEMAYGRTPFKGRNRKETFRNVVGKGVEFVGRSRSDLNDLIGRLLVKDPVKRLGYGGGAEEIKRHPFFRGVRWEMLGEVTRPPYFASAEELDEAVGSPGVDGNEVGFSIREYFEKLHLADKEEREETEC